MAEAFATVLIAVLAWGIMVERRLAALQRDVHWLRLALGRGGFNGDDESGE